MDIRIQVRDRRTPGWYYVNNEVYDSEPPLEALGVYNAIARYANNDTERAYFSGKKWKRHHKVGHSKLAKGIRWLLEKKLIAPTGDKTLVGALYFDLLSTDHLKKAGGVPPQNRVVSQGETGSGSTVEPGGVPPQNTNYTRNKTKKRDKKTIADKPPALLRRLTDLIGEAHKHLTGETLVWVGKSKAYGQAMKSIMQIIEPLADDDARYKAVRQKCGAFVQACATDDFLKKQGVTPLSVLSNWNKLHYKKTGSTSAFESEPEHPFPAYQSMSLEQLEETFHNWTARWSIADLKKNISPESYSRYLDKDDGNTFAPNLPGILDRENRERVHKKSA